MKISLLTLTYNEERSVKAFLDHYSFCDEIVVYDNLSTDSTVSEIKKYRPDAKIISFDTGNLIDNRKFLEIKNNAWKGTDADWQIVVDFDEYLYNPMVEDSIPYYLSLGINRKWTLIPTVGFDMHSDNFSNTHPPEISDASFSYMYGKIAIFNPKKIKDINYHIGCHQCDPVGEISITTPHLFLLHYRYFGFEDWQRRNREYLKRVGDIPGAFHYRLQNETIKTAEDYRQEFESNRMDLSCLFNLKGHRNK